LNTFTQTDIAYECPFTHGTAVYTARALVTPYDPIGTMYYNVCETDENYNPANRIHSLDWEEDEQAETPLNRSENKMAVSLFPNPNKGAMRIAYYLPQIKSEGQITIYNALGKLIKQYELNINAQQLTINEPALENGLYYYTIMVDDEIVKTDKFIIIK
jgi:hypothetical protein